MTEIVITNVRLSKEQARDLDLLIKKKIFSSRAEAIRTFLRDYIREEAKQ
jgi:Arc/MetJ-type ribon-helix-helix transcriptional regulator